MTAIQTLRAKAKTAGNLKPPSPVTVVQQLPQVIVIQPTNPQVVYVPVYNPAVSARTATHTSFRQCRCSASHRCSCRRVSSGSVPA